LKSSRASATSVRGVGANAALIGLAMIASCLGQSGCTGDTPRVERVILISIDTLRPDFLDCYEPVMGNSPNVDRLAREGIVFTDVLSQAPSTTISHKSMLYSVYPEVHKTARDRVPEEHVESPVETLRRAGYTTAAFVGGGGLAPELGFPKGFEAYEVLPKLRTGRQLEALRVESLRWLGEHRDETFFLFLHMYQPHCPYSPPPEYVERYAGWYAGDIDPSDKCGDYYNSREMSDDDYRYVRALYTGEVAYVDDFLGSLFAELKRLGLYDRVMIVITSDHGDSLGERGYVGHNLLFNVQLRVPLVVRVPGLAPRRIDAPLESIDIMPTIYAAVGLSPALPFQGNNLLPLMEGRRDVDEDRLRFANQWDRVSVRRGPWHVVFGGPEEGTVLYDVSRDPEELNNLAPRNPRVVADLRSSYRDLMASSRNLSDHFVLAEDSRPVLEKDTLERLKSLGYIR
jgi:arylsulfatase A-like enzyme